MTDRKPPLESIRALLTALPAASAKAGHLAQNRQTRLTKPEGSLGRLEAIALFLAAWQDNPRPVVHRPTVLIFVANHGIAAKGVSAYPSSVTRAMLENFTKGGAAINQLCRTFELGMRVFDVGLDRPTKDLTTAAALDEQELHEAFAIGTGAVADSPDLICLGEMGIGNTTSAAAIYRALYGGAATDWVGRGTGLDEEGLKRKIVAVEAAVSYHSAHLSDPLEVLRRLGGREIAAVAGAIVAARQARIPVILDGYVVCAAAAVLAALNGTALDHCLAGHRSSEGAHQEVLRRLGKEPLLDLGLRLGEGSGAALAFAIVRAALACHNGMATFEEAQVAQKI